MPRLPRLWGIWQWILDKSRAQRAREAKTDKVTSRSIQREQPRVDLQVVLVSKTPKLPTEREDQIHSAGGSKGFAFTVKDIDNDEVWTKAEEVVSSGLN